MNTYLSVHSIKVELHFITFYIQTKKNNQKNAKIFGETRDVTTDKFRLFRSSPEKVNDKSEKKRKS